MPVYLISYELKQDRKAYAAFYDKLKGMACRSPMTGAQYVETDRTAPQLFMDLSSLIEGDDRLLIVEITKGADWFSYGTPNDHWLRERVPQR
jgi:hypothetical protein